MGIIIAIAVAFLVAFLICNGLKNATSNVAIKQEASNYVDSHDVSIEIRTDTFTHESVTRRPIDNNKQ